MNTKKNSRLLAKIKLRRCVVNLPLLLTIRVRAPKQMNVKKNCKHTNFSTCDCMRVYINTKYNNKQNVARLMTYVHCDADAIIKYLVSDK